MAYLLAKYTLLFLLTAFLGFLLGRWWSRRSFVDVTESYQSLNTAAASNDGMWNSLWQRLDNIDGNIGPNVRKELGAIPKPEAPVVDLSGVQTRLDSLAERVDAIRIPEPEETDLSSVEARLDAVQNKIAAIRIPEPKEPDLSNVETRLEAVQNRIDAIRIPEPKEPDLSSVEARLDAVQNKIAAIRIPEPKAADLSSVEAGLDAVQNKIAAIRIPDAPKIESVNVRLEKLERSVRDIPRPEKQHPVDLNPLQGRLTSIEQTIRQLPKVETHPPVDIGPLSSRIAEMDQRIGRINIPQAVDIQPIDQRLNSIELALKGLRSAPPTPPRKQRKPQVKRKVQRSAGPRLFKTAAHGKKDDLKKISGVGPKLERLLNRNGVYYFWQVADWFKKDIDFIDARLQVFKGRISRDNWVSQAKTLKRAEGAAKQPR